MDNSAASVVYSNPFYAQNYTGAGELDQQPQEQLQHPNPNPNQHQMFHANYMDLEMGPGLNPNPNPQRSPRRAFNDIYRYENGSGDATGNLLLGRNGERFCRDEAGEDDRAAQLEGPMSISPSSSLVASTSSSCPTGESLNQGMDSNRSDEQVDRGDMTEMGEFGALSQLTEEEQREQRPPFSPSMGGNTSYMVFPRTAADYMPRLPLARHTPYLNVGQEQYVIQQDTIFVLGMRLNVTKNDIIVFFGKLGMIKTDEATNKPKIFVYKNKMTGRSKGEATITYTTPFSAQAAISCLSGAKFMGQTLTVLPAYLSTRRGSVRYIYPKELNCPENQRRQRALRWKPASDNWVCMICRNSNFVWRASCNRCQAAKLTAAQDKGASSNARRWRPQKTDWPCGFCFNLNFWYRAKCNRCHAPKSDDPPASGSGSEEDTWELLLNPPSPDASQDTPTQP
ncbi:uncharacterized protein LOC108025074 [Drosophila biarmipes]|uniref:uncharacterized protein LOC108025074 n=1 Tax=Drosophila biarmipes TaxID=125945 RepID=UPI0007E6473B|nr:uncharacterized protein LOC108025074 [Drosophila biarmipes]